MERVHFERNRYGILQFQMGGVGGHRMISESNWELSRRIAKRDEETIQQSQVLWGIARPEPEIFEPTSKSLATYLSLLEGTHDND